MPKPLLCGEHRRVLDERYRVSIPADMAEVLCGEGDKCLLTKERAGVLSLWRAGEWQEKLDAGLRLVQDKIQAGRLDGRIEEVQRLGRLLSTRHVPVHLANRSRLLIPEGFRDFLGVLPGGELVVVGAALCVELWRPEAWCRYIDEQMQDFRSLFDQLSS